MKKKTWIARIKTSCMDAGTYRPYFDNVIDTLAGILEARDEAEKTYKEDGCIPVIEYTNKSGATNKIKNPKLTVWDDLNKSALAYWRDLGLTPAGLRKIDESAMKQRKRSSLAEALRELGG